MRLPDVSMIELAILTDQSVRGVVVVAAAVVVTVTESTWTPPAAVVGVTRTLLVPAASAAVRVMVFQVSQPPVAAKGSEPAEVPLTEMAAGRSLLSPFAYLKASVPLPAVAALTENSTKLAAALSSPEV